jgi:hypothetical protein
VRRHILVVCAGGILGGLIGWFGAGLVQWGTCPFQTLPHYRASLLTKTSCMVEIRPGRWIGLWQVDQYRELCK